MHRRRSFGGFRVWAVAAAALLGGALPLPAQTKYASHPPLRTSPGPGNRALGSGPNYFVDAAKGQDENPGTQEKPWRTLAHGLKQLKPGDTLVLRAGTYYEPLYVTAQGTPEKPIVIRSYPAEVAIVDGGLPEFQLNPAQAWEPVPASEGGVEGEYRSKQNYQNLRDIVGAFGDSMVGLQTYWHLQDLRAKNEFWDDLPAPAGAAEADAPAAAKPEAKPDAKAGAKPEAKSGGRIRNRIPKKSELRADVVPCYVGPGVFYNRLTGRIHVRLAHTHIDGVTNYQGETDPRKLPLVLAPFRSSPLHLDEAKHVKVQDLTVRGGGYETARLDMAYDVDLDNVTIHGGTYNLRCTNTRKLRFWRSALYGNLPPWGFRTENSLRNRPGRGLRDVARLSGHALWTLGNGEEYSTYAMPLNDDWEIAYSEFTDNHDGLYLGAVNLKFHHNLVAGMQDDGIYLSPMYARLERGGDAPKLEIYQNVFRGILTPLAYGGFEDTADTVFVYRNIFDMRERVNRARPTSDKPKVEVAYGGTLGDHGGPPWSVMNIYQNTFVLTENPRNPTANTFEQHGKSYAGWQVFNNAYIYLRGVPKTYGAVKDNEDIGDGLLFWSPKNGSSVTTEAFFSGYRTSPAVAKSKAKYPPGNNAHSKVGDPKFAKLVAEEGQVNDYSLTPGSAAIDAGVPVPADFPDPLRQQDKGAPDIGALPAGAAMLQVGRSAAP